MEEKRNMVVKYHSSAHIITNIYSNKLYDKTKKECKDKNKNNQGSCAGGKFPSSKRKT